MKLILIAACLAACQAAKLNRGYLPPESARTAGGNGDILQTPFRSQGGENLPTGLPAGSYVNDFEGVVIDADAAGTRATHSGLGNPRETYGSTDSKVGAAAFRETNLNANKQGPKPTNQEARPHFVHVNHHIPNVAGLRQPVLQTGEQGNTLVAERFHASRDRASNIIAYQNDVGISDFNYAFQTDNGISAAEAGMALEGVRSKGGYSYTGDDGQVYTISYTADEAGYRPQGSHIPTPPPIPAEILKALEQNAKDEAAGIVDDGSYDAKKYNTAHTKGDTPNDYNDKHNTLKRPVFNVISDINQNSQANKPNRDEDQNNGQSQLTNGYTVNDKQISNFSNIRNQYENKFDILTSNKFNNNGPISNFKDLGEAAQLSNERKNQSQNVPLSQQKLQKENEVPDSLNGRPNSYQAPISAIRNQQQNNQAALQKQTQAQLRPSTYQSSFNGEIQYQQQNNQAALQKQTQAQVVPNNYQSPFNGANQYQQQNNQAALQKQTQAQVVPNNYQSSFNGANQYQQQNNQAALQKQTQAQLRPSTHQSSFNGANQYQQQYNQATLQKQTQAQVIPNNYQSSFNGVTQKQQALKKQENGFVNSNNFQSRPNAYQTQTTGALQGQQNFNKKGTIFQTRFQNNFNANHQNKQSFNSGIPSTQYTSKQATSVNKPQNNIQSQTLNSQANIIFSTNESTNTQTRPISYQSTTTGIKQIANVGSVFSSSNQNRPTPNYASISGIFANPTAAQSEPSPQDGSITVTYQNQQQQSGSIFSKPTTPQSRPISYDASTTGTIQKQQQIIKQQPIANSGNVFPSATANQGKPTSYYYDSLSGTNQKQQPIANLANIFSTVNPTQARPTTSFSGAYQNQQLSNSGNTFSKPTTTQPRPTSTTKEEPTTITTIDNSLLQQNTHQNKPGSQSQQLNFGVNNGFSNSGHSIDVQHDGELYEYPKPEENSEGVGNFPSFLANIQKPTFNNPSTIQTRPNSFNQGTSSAQFINKNSQQSIKDINRDSNSNPVSLPINNDNNKFIKPSTTVTNSNYEASVTRVPQQSNYDQANANRLQNNLNTNQQNQENLRPGVASVQINKDSNSASSNFDSPAINSQINVLENPVNTDVKQNSQDASTGEGNPNQRLYIIGAINKFQNGENPIQQNRQNLNLGVPFDEDINSQSNIGNNNNVHISDSVSQFSSNVPSSPNVVSSFEQPLHSLGFHSTSSPFTFNAPSRNDNENNKGLVAISSSQSHNNNLQSNFLYKKLSIRRQQQENKQAFSDFLQSKNIANAPVLISSNYNAPSPTSQPGFEFSNLNPDNNQGSTLQLLTPSQLNEPNPTSQTFGVTESDTKLFTAEPSRLLSTPKEDTVEVSQGTSGITQASISPFPTFGPSTSKQSGSFNSVSQSSSLPSQAIGSSLGVSSFGSHSQGNLGFNLGFGNVGSSANRQNQGEIYEYPKPDEILPAPTKASDIPSQTNFESSLVNNNRQNEVESPTSNKLFGTQSGNGPKLLPSRPNVISNSCCFSQNNGQNQNSVNNDGSDLSSESKTSTFLSAKEEFEGPKTPQSYDETGYHY